MRRNSFNLVTADARTSGSRGRSRLAAGSLAVALAVAGIGVATSAPAAADIVQQIKDSQGQLDALNRAAEAAAERYNAGRIKLADTKRKAQTAQAALGRAEQVLAGLRGQVSAVAAAVYKSGTAGQGLSLITDGTPGTFLDKMSSLDRISQAQAQVMASLATARHRQASAAAAAAAASADATATLGSLQKDKAQVESAAAQAQRVLAGLQDKQRRLIQAARDAVARQAAVARAQALAAEASRAAAAAAAFSSSPVTVQAPPSVSRHYSGSAAAIALQVAKDQLGKPYVWGAAGPDSFDCSGLTLYAYAQAGIALPHYTGDQWNQGRHVSQSELRPGDLVFFEKNLGHMGMYIGNGSFVHAPHTGDVVKISSLSGYYQNEYAGAVRLAG